MSSPLFLFKLARETAAKNTFSKAVHTQRQHKLINTLLTCTHSYTPGFSYIGSNHNLSNSRRRPFEHLRRVRKKEEPGLLILKREKNRTNGKQSQREKQMEC